MRGNLEPEQLPEHMRGPLDVSGKRLLVVGGGDTSMDCVRTAIRLGAIEVTCMYRRTEAEQKGREEERRHAVEEGTTFMYLTVPYSFVGEGNVVKSAQCRKMQLGAPDESGRRRPEPIKGSEFVLDVDIVVLAIVTSLHLLKKRPRPAHHHWKTVRVAMTSDHPPLRFARRDNVRAPTALSPPCLRPPRLRAIATTSTAALSRRQPYLAL